MLNDLNKEYCDYCDPNIGFQNPMEQFVYYVLTIYCFEKSRFEVVIDINSEISFTDEEMKMLTDLSTVLEPVKLTVVA